MTILPPPEAAAAHLVAFAALASRGKWQPARHLQLIARAVMDMESGAAPPRLAVSTPPRHGKSHLCSRYLPAWWLGRHPEHAVAVIACQEGFARKWGRLARDSFMECAPSLWGVTCLPRASTATWEVYRDHRRTEGMMQSIGAGGTITGKGANMLVLEDLIRDLAEAQNSTLRERQWEWCQSAIETRLEPPGNVLAVSTRWHHMDLIGRLKKMQEQGELGDEWRFLNLPAICEEDEEPWPRGLGRKAGEALWPERFSVEWLRKKEKNVGPYVWQSLYQGRPVPATGSIFKREWLRHYGRGDRIATVPGRGSCHIPDLLRFATVDLAASKKASADYTVIATWGFHPTWRVLLLLDLDRRRLDGDEIIPALQQVRALDLMTRPKGRAPMLFYVEREGALLADKLGDVLKEAVRQLIPVQEIPRSTDKRSRAMAATGAFAAGAVFFPERASFLADLEEELLTFTGVDDDHDDQVDAVSDACALFQEWTAPEAVQDREEEERRAEEGPRFPPGTFPDDDLGAGGEWGDVGDPVWS